MNKEGASRLQQWSSCVQPGSTEVTTGARRAAAVRRRKVPYSTFKLYRLSRGKTGADSSSSSPAIARCVTFVRATNVHAVHGNHDNLQMYQLGYILNVIAIP